MFLSDADILAAIETGDIKITPFEASCLQAASYDFALGEDLLIPVSEPTPLDITRVVHRKHTLSNAGYLIEPRQFLLGETAEVLTLGDSIAAQVCGRSTIGRKGLGVHITAGWVDPGWSGRLTLELYNHGPAPIRLLPGMRIGQFVFGSTLSRCQKPYAGNYQNATGVQAPRA